MFTHIRRLVFIVLAALVVLPMPGASATATRQSIAVPLYEYPTIGTLWNDITGAGSNTVPFVIVNPGNGPGSSVDSTYTNKIANNTANGIRSIGYVYSNYQDRPWQQVYDDIVKWYQMYPGISGIFVDLVETGGSAEQCYIATLYNHVKNTHPNDLFILNPGTNISPAYEPYGDIFMNAENNFATYQSSWHVTYPGFEDNPLYQNRFWHAVHTMNSSDLSTAIALMRANNAGWVYLTDDTMPNAYKQTPSYWTSEVANVGALPASTIPNRGKTTLPSGCVPLTVAVTNTADTSSAKQTTVTAAFAIKNNDTTYGSEPTTKLELLHVPVGVTTADMSGSGWACPSQARSCSYGSVLGTNTIAPKVTATLQVGCSYPGGNATVRLTNFAGNTSEASVVLTPPQGCNATDPAASVVKPTNGTTTTTSTPTTPAIKAPAASNTPAPASVDSQATSPASTVQVPLRNAHFWRKNAGLIGVMGVLCLACMTWSGWHFRQRIAAKFHRRSPPHTDGPTLR